MCSDKTFLLELRDQAKLTSDEVLRGALYDSANTLEFRLKETFAFPNEANMQLLNSAWARADRVLRAAKDATPTGPQGGALHAPKEPEVTQAQTGTQKAA